MAKARKRRGRRRSNKFFAYPVKVDLALGALAAGSTVAGSLTAFGVTKVRCISADLAFSLNDATSGQGPILVGCHSSDLSVTEVNENLDARPTSQSDIIAMERSRRPVRQVGKLIADETGGNRLNHGDEQRVKLGFTLDTGTELQVFARNEDTAVLVTGGIVHVSGTLFMTWI